VEVILSMLISLDRLLKRYSNQALPSFPEDYLWKAGTCDASVHIDKQYFHLIKLFLTKITKFDIIVIGALIVIFFCNTSLRMN